MPITTPHKEYSAKQKDWTTVRDCVAGSSAVKAKGEVYLPKPNADDTSMENKKRYEQYVCRAQFFEVTGNTRKGLVGAIFRKEPVSVLPDSMQYLLEDADAGGQSLTQLTKWMCGEVMETGRVGILTEFSDGEPAKTQAEAMALGKRAKLLPYSTESIFNWRHEMRNGRLQLTMVILKEELQIPEDEFTYRCEDQYRVLGLDGTGYYQETYDKDGKLVSARIYPLDGSGNKWQRIPFFIAGAEDNRPDIDVAPLLGIANLNVAHYRNSADYEEGVFMHGQGTLFLSIGDMASETFKGHNPNGVLLGARKGIVLGNGGSADLVQMAANGAAREAMTDKEQRMIMLGARLITNEGKQQTAEEARMHLSAEGSALSSVATNVSECIEAALEAAAVYSNVDPEGIEFELSQQFFDHTYDPQAAAAKIMELDRQLIAKSDYRAWLRKTGQVESDRTDEAIDEEIGSNPDDNNDLNLE